MRQSNSLGAESGGVPDSGGGSGRDPRLAGFGEGGCYGRSLPSSAVTGVLEELADGTGRPPADAADDEVIGMLGCWQALEAHAHARLLAVIRELLRRRAKDGCPAAYRGDLPGQWEKGAAYEAAAELGISWQAAVPLLHLAWELEARLPGTGLLLEEGVLTAFKVKIIVDEFAFLDDEKAAEAEARLLEKDLGSAEMTPGKLRRLCQRLSDTVDPEGARKRREDAQRERARVAFFRAHGGDTAMFAEGLPADDALMAQQGIQARALEYKEVGIYPDAAMDLLRVLAMLDLINQATLDDRIARYRAEQGEDPPVPDTGPGAGPPGRNQDPPDSGPPGEGGHGRDPGGGSGNGPGGAFGKTREPGLPSLVNLTFPLATLMGMANRPGEVPGYGSVDPGLVENLGAAAAASPRTRYCFTVTDKEGHAAGHACARLLRESRGRGSRGRGSRGRGSQGRGARNREAGGTAGGRGHAAEGWNLEPDPRRAGPEGGYGTWVLSVPGGARYLLDIHPVPLHSCDHRFATDAYRPGKLLRHLVDIRDGECSSVSCSHPARSCDYEHGIPWHKSGVTDACNAGPVSRSCHQVKQSPGWSLSQPEEPGRHLWRTPSGRTYEKGPKSYPA